MKRTPRLAHGLFVSPTLATLVALAACAGGQRVDPVDPGSRAGMPPTVARLATAFERVCDHPDPCDPSVRLSADERASCLDFARAAIDAPCAAEVAASYACGEGHIACGDGGEIEEAATDAAVRGACPEEMAALEACCAKAPGSLLCGVEADDDWDEGGDDGDGAGGA